MSVTGWLALLWLVAGSVSDVWVRRIPNWLVGSGALVAFGGWLLETVTLSPWGCLLGLVLTWLARLPPGDHKAIMLGGVLLGPLPTAIALSICYGFVIPLLLVAPTRWDISRWPLFPFFAVPACGILLVQSLGSL